MKNVGKLLRSAVSVMISAATVLTMALCLPFNTLDTEAAKKVTQADINAARDKIKANEKKIQEYQAELERLGDDIADALKVKEQLDQQIQYIQTNVDETEDLIVKYGQLIREKEELIADRENQISQKYDDFLERLRISYEDGSQNYLELLISSDSIIDFITRIDNLGSVLTYEQTMMNELEKEVNDLEELKKSLAIKKDEYVQLGNYQSQTRAELDSKLAEAEAIVEKLKSDEKAAEKAYQNVTKQDAALNKELETLLKEYDKQQQAEQAGAYLWPLDSNYRTVTSKYGNRILWGQPDFHLGVDLAAPYGANIYAAKDGTVVKAQYNSSYGYYVLIDHGGGKATLYAHSSKLLVVAGQKVTRGQIIAKVGSTGNSSGYHLHFEVRVNGKTTEPFVTGQLVISDKGKMVDPIAEKLLTYKC